jgi:hypothetical protein
VIGSYTAATAEIPVDSITGVMVNYATVDLTAWQDAAHGFLPDIPVVKIQITGPWDSGAQVAAAASAAAPTLSGSHTILSALYNIAPPQGNAAAKNLSLAVCYGIRGYYTTADPAFGITPGTAANGFWLSNYTVDMANGKYSATFDLYPGSVIPTWINVLPA